MRVLHVMASGATGGGATHLTLLLPALVTVGVEVCAAVGSDGPLLDQLHDLGIEVAPISLMRSRIDPLGIVSMAAAVRRCRADLVHYHGIRAAFFGSLASFLLPRIPRVYTAHGLAYNRPARDWRHVVFLAAERIACARASHVVSVSGPDREDLVRRGFVARAASTHIENPVDIGHYRVERGSRESLRAQLGLRSTDRVVVTVSRLVPQKAVHDLIDAVAACQEPMQLVVIGDGPQRQALVTRAAKGNLRVLFLGERLDVAELWPAFDVFALSSHWEGEPVALLEAMAAGLPCVATATEGASSLLDGHAGVLVPVGNAAALARALDDMARLAPEGRLAQGERARERVLNRQPTSIASRLREVYVSVLANAERC